MPEITRDWMERLTKRELEKALALGFYHYRTQLVFIEANVFFQAVTDLEKSEKQRLAIMQEFFSHWYVLFASLVCVVQEGFTELKIEDSKLNRLAASANIPMLRRFRNATFHYQPHVRSPKHDEYLKGTGFVAAKNLFDRQGVLIRRLARLSKLNPNFGSSLY